MHSNSCYVSSPRRQLSSFPSDPVEPESAVAPARDRPDSRLGVSAQYLSWHVPQTAHGSGGSHLTGRALIYT